MDQNSIKMSEHLVATLRLNPDNSDPWAKNMDALSEQEIMDQALVHDLPIFVIALMAALMIMALQQLVLVLLLPIYKKWM